MTNGRLRGLELLGVALAAGIALAGCGAGDTETSGGGEAAATPRAGGGADSPAEAGQPGSAGSGAGGADANRGAGSALLPPQKLVQTASLSVEVTDVTRAVRAAEDKVLTAGGQIQSEQTSSASNGDPNAGQSSASDPERITSADLVLRVPPDAYERTVRDLAGLGKLLSQGRDTKDVTQQVVDVQSRIETQRASLDRVRALLANATKLGDVISLEGQLTRREADLESLLAQQKALAEQTDRGTVNLHLVAAAAEPVQQEQKGTELGFLAGLRNGWQAFTGFVGVVMLVFGALLPFIVAGVLVAAAAIPLVHRFRRQPASRAAAASETPPTG